MSDELRSAIESGEITDDGQWIGECEKCCTNHEGYLPGTVGAHLACLSAQARQFGGEIGEQIEADVAALNAYIARKRDEALARYFRS